MKLKWNALMRRHEMLLQFLLPYLCMMLLFVPLTIFTTNRLLNTVTQHTADILYQELERTSDLFDRQFSELKDLSYTLAKDPAVVAVGNLPPPEDLAPADYIDLMVLEEDIVRYYQIPSSVEILQMVLRQILRLDVFAAPTAGMAAIVVKQPAQTPVGTHAPQNGAVFG